MKSLSPIVVATLVYELGLHEELREKFSERFDLEKFSWVRHIKAAKEVIWFKRLLGCGPVSQVEHPQEFGDLLRVVDRLQLPGILDRCGVIINGDGTKEMPFSAALRKEG